MKTWVVIAWSLGILGVLTLLCVAALWLERCFPGEAYDERQKLARNSAYRISFWVGNVYYLGVMTYLIAQVGGQTVRIEPFILIFIGFSIQSTVLHICCLINHAVLPIGEKPYMTIVCYLFIAFINLVSSREGLLPEQVSLVGQESTGFLRLIMVIDFTSLAIMHILRLLIREKE